MLRESVQLDDEARKLLESYLDDVDRHLPRETTDLAERRSIVDDLHGQILDMLAVTPRERVGVDDVRQALAGLDSPEAFASNAAPSASSNPDLPPAHDAAVPLVPPVPNARQSGRRLCLTAVAATGLSVVACGPFLWRTFFWLMPDLTRFGSHGRLAGGPWPTLSRFPLSWPGFGFGGTLTTFLVAGSCLLGVIAIGQIRSSGGLLYGWGLAFLNVMLLPMLVLNRFLFGLPTFLIGAPVWRSGFSVGFGPSFRGSFLGGGLLLLFVLLVDGLLLWLIWQRVRPTEVPA